MTEALILNKSTRKCIDKINAQINQQLQPKISLSELLGKSLYGQVFQRLPLNADINSMKPKRVLELLNMKSCIP